MKTSLEIENWLHQTVGFEFFEPGLERIIYCIEYFNLQPSCKIITVGGTNGKGSVTRLIASSLSQKYNVAQFTSPHLFSICERFSCGEKLITISKLHDYLVQILNDLGRVKIKLSYYELLFVAFLLWVKELNPDFMILEVGLGGRLDAVNALDADVAVVTSIGRDHQEFLGEKYKEILMEKLAIAREGKRLITGFELKYLTHRAKSYCSSKKVSYINIAEKCNFNDNNIQIVKSVLEGLKVNLPVLSSNVDQQNDAFKFYGSHNPAAVRKLVQFLVQAHYNDSENKFDLLILSFSHRKEKDLVHMVKLFKMLHPNCVSEIVLTSFNHFKAEKQEVLQKIANENGIEFVQNIKNHISANKRILVSGSNYFYRTIADFFQLSS